MKPFRIDRVLIVNKTEYYEPVDPKDRWVIAADCDQALVYAHGKYPAQWNVELRATEASWIEYEEDIKKSKAASAR